MSDSDHFPLHPYHQLLKLKITQSCLRFIGVFLCFALIFLLSNVCFGPCRAKYAIGAIKKKLIDKNPHVALYALEVRRVYSGKYTAVYF